MQNRKRDTDVQNRLLDSVREGEGGMFRENSIETSILSRMKQIISPGWMPETSAQGWCTGKTQRDGMGREAGGGMGWGTHVNPWLIHVNVWQKPLQYCKVISLQLINISGKKFFKKKFSDSNFSFSGYKETETRGKGILCINPRNVLATAETAEDPGVLTPWARPQHSHGSIYNLTKADR